MGLLEAMVDASFTAAAIVASRSLYTPLQGNDAKQIGAKWRQRQMARADADLTSPQCFASAAERLRPV